MDIIISKNKSELSKKAADKGAQFINEFIESKGYANIIVGTGTSQLEMLDQLTKQDIDWGKVNSFHLDEYIGISENHSASFRKFMKEKFADKISLKDFIYVNGQAEDLDKECSRLEHLINRNPIDVAFIGIGENGHLAFNDPPANFETEKAYLVVELDKTCREQQVNEGWFSSLDEVPESAITMSIRKIMESKRIICTTPSKRKAKAVRNTIQMNVSNLFPSTILQTHENATIFLDMESSSLLNETKK